MVTYPISYEIIIWEKPVDKIGIDQSNWYCKQVFNYNFYIMILETKHKINLLSNAFLSHNLNYITLFCAILSIQSGMKQQRYWKEFYLNLINCFFIISL